MGAVAPSAALEAPAGAQSTPSPTSWDISSRVALAPRTGPGQDLRPACCRTGRLGPQVPLQAPGAQPQVHPGHTPGVKVSGLPENTLHWGPRALWLLEWCGTGGQCPVPLAMRACPRQPLLLQTQEVPGSAGMPGHLPAAAVLMEPTWPSNGPGALGPALGVGPSDLAREEAQAPSKGERSEAEVGGLVGGLRATKPWCAPSASGMSMCPNSLGSRAQTQV